MTLYLMDANVLIRAHGDYYPIDRIAPFWDWLLAQAQADRIKMPRQIFDEVANSPDLLGQWLWSTEVRRAIILAETTNMATVQTVISQGYAPDLDDIELLALTRDPFLVAAALGGPDRIVATRERSKRTQQRAKRKVPDVCATMGIECIDDYELWRQLAFRIA